LADVAADLADAVLRGAAADAAAQAQRVSETGSGATSLLRR
jgi:hypothetical protein